MTDRSLDTSDLDNYMGKPLQAGRMKEAINNTDIRRWVQAMHYPNLLHYDADFAAESRFGQLVAPQSFAVCTDDGHGATPACVGRIPGSHLIFGGDEWWFFGLRVVAGHSIVNERVPFDYVVKETKFAGPTCFQRGDNNYHNQNGDLVARQRSTGIRYRKDLAIEMASLDDPDDPEWSDVQLAELEDRKLDWIRSLHDLGHGKRFWEDVNFGDKLPERVFGPHSIVSFTTEWRSYLFTVWGGTHRVNPDFEAMGFDPAMAGHENDGVMERINPELTDGAYFGPSRGHLFPRWARYVGMPRGYGYGASMGAWILDYLAGWAGEWGQVVHSNANYRGPALTGDITVQTGEIVDKMTDAEGRKLVQVKSSMKNQLGTTLATAIAEIELPTRG